MATSPPGVSHLSCCPDQGARGGSGLAARVLPHGGRFPSLSPYTTVSVPPRSAAFGFATWDEPSAAIHRGKFPCPKKEPVANRPPPSGWRGLFSAPLGR